MDWSPFVVCADGEAPPRPRGINTPEGLGDRLRTAAFAERQARDAFLWAAAQFSSAPQKLAAAWRTMAEERGKAAEESFQKTFAARDPETAGIFAKIAAEEEGHIAVQRRAGAGAL